MSQIRVPAFLQNLFRDLRDRRLLVPAIALLAGLFAVPILLQRHSSTSTPPGSAVSASAAREARMVPAVVTRQLGVTNYRKRLNQLQSKNPFHQQYTQTPSSAKLHVAPTSTSGSPASGAVPTGTASASAGTTGTTGVAAPAPTSPPSGATTPVSSPPATSSGDSSTAAPHHHQDRGPRYYTWRISVKVGEPSQLKERPEVQRLALLPSDARPALSFLGATEDGSKAVFLVSADVDAVSGQGHCLPSRSACRYYVMKPGQKAHFHYAPAGTRYNLVLLDIHPVDVTDKLPTKPTGQARPQRRLSILGDG